MDEFVPATHTQVRELLLKLQKLGGAMIQPLILYDILTCIMIRFEDEITQMSKLQIRDVSATFCALCNEFFLIYCRDKKPKTQFYVSEERWKKYFLEQKVRENSIDFLQRHDLVRCEQMKNPRKTESIVMGYTINFDMLSKYCRIAGEIHDKVNANQYKEMFDKFDEAFACACARASTHA